MGGEEGLASGGGGKQRALSSCRGWLSTLRSHAPQSIAPHAACTLGWRSLSALCTSEARCEIESQRISTLELSTPSACSRTSSHTSRVRARIALIACFDGATVEIAAIRTSLLPSVAIRRSSSCVISSDASSGFWSRKSARSAHARTSGT